jgi:adenylyl- and sulfurtransferase ThiI
MIKTTLSEINHKGKNRFWFVNQIKKKIKEITKQNKFNQKD